MLTTKDFIKEVKAIGFVAIAGDGYFIVKDSKGYNVAFVDTTIMYRFDTIYIDFEELSEFDRKRLFDLLVKYASTPLEEREEQERFFLKFKIEIGGKYEYLNYYKEENVLTLDNSLETSGVQTRFTDKELKELKEKFGVTLSDFEKIPFKDKEKEEC